jgi:hypothetical protein
MGAKRMRCCILAVLLALASGATAAELDSHAVQYVPPGEFKWVRNKAGTNEQAVLFGTSTRSGSADRARHYTRSMPWKSDD